MPRKELSSYNELWQDLTEDLVAAMETCSETELLQLLVYLEELVKHAKAKLGA